MNSRFLINLISNIANFGFSALVGIWLTPYLIRHLGVGAYGLIPLATTLTSYLTLFTVALTSVWGRFMTIALERKDYDEANRVFNTSFWSTAGVLLVLLIPCLWLVCHARLVFSVPPGYEWDFMWLALAALGMFNLTTLTTGFGVSAFCRNRFDLTNAVNILSTIIRVTLVVLLFSYNIPKVWHVGASLLIATICSSVGSYCIWKYLTPMIELRMKWFSLSTFHQMTGMGWWIVINSVGSLLYLSIDLLVVNHLFGAEATGQYGAVMIWSSLLRSFAGVIAGVFAPTMIMYYSQNDLNGLVRYSRHAVKFLGLIVAIPIGLICGMSKPLLHLWLGPSFTHLAPLMSLMTFHLCVNLAILPLFHIQVSTNHVRLPGIVTCIMGLLNLGLAVFLASFAGWGMFGVAMAGAIMLTAKNLVFTPLYVAHVLRLKWTAFYRETLPVVTLTLALAVSGSGVSSWLTINSWQRLLLAASLMGAISLGIIIVFILDKGERSYIRQMLGGWKRVEA